VAKVILKPFQFDFVVTDAIDAIDAID